MTNKIYIGNLSFGTSDQDLQTLLGGYGPISSLSLIKDKFTGKSKGFAFVEFENKEDMDRAISELNGNEFQGRALRVNEAQDKPRDRDHRGFRDRDSRDNRDSRPRRREW